MRNMLLPEDWQDLMKRYFIDLKAHPGSVTDDFSKCTHSLVFDISLIIAALYPSCTLGQSPPFDYALDLASNLDYLERHIVELSAERQSLYSELCRFGRWALCELVRRSPQSESLPFKPRDV